MRRTMRVQNWQGMPKRELKGRRPRGRHRLRQSLGRASPWAGSTRGSYWEWREPLGSGCSSLIFSRVEKAAKQGNSDGSPVYANDTMPQDVKEMALKMPEASTTVAAATSSSGYQRPANVGNPFVGYQGTTGGSTSSSRATGADSTNVATRDYQGAAAAEAKVEAEAAARRAPMEVATKLTAGLTTGASAQINSSTVQSSSDRTSNPASVTAAAPGIQPQNLVGGATLSGELYARADIPRLQRPTEQEFVFSGTGGISGAKRRTTRGPGTFALYHFCRHDNPCGT